MTLAKVRMTALGGLAVAALAVTGTTPVGAAVAEAEGAASVPQAVATTETMTPPQRVALEPGAGTGPGAATFRMDPPSGNGRERPSPRQGLPSPWTFYTLQLNLCNSGAAPCYDENQGQSVGEAVGLIEDKRPDLLTLNEICRNDMYDDLYPAMQDLWPNEWVFAVFFPAYEAYDDGVWPPGTKTCQNGQDYGSALIGRSFADIDDDPPSTGVHHAPFPPSVQNPTATEYRSWGCVDVPDTLWACTTHLDSADQLWAMEQCQFLMYDLLPGLQEDWGELPSIVGGDLNMEYPFVQSCVPDGWWRKGDDDVQHIMYTDDFEFLYTEAIEMEHTDHPAWLVAAATPGTVDR